MLKRPPDSNQFLQYENNNDTQMQQHFSPQVAIQQSRKQYFYFKLTISVILVILATASVQTQMQYFAPFVRTVQNFFNYHLLQHDSQDIYEGGDVIFYRTQQYKMAPAITGFFKRYTDTMDTFQNDSFFYPQPNKPLSLNSHQSQIVKVLIIYQVDEKDQSDLQFSKKVNQSQLRSHTYVRDRIFFTTHQKQWILQRPLHQLRQFFNLTVLNKQFYQKKLKRIQLQINLDIKFKDHQNCTVEFKTICIFYSGMMMAVKVETRVLDYHDQNPLQTNSQQKNYNDHNLGIRKLSEFHNVNFNFKQIGYVIFVVNCVLFCIQLMVIIRTNSKIQQNLKEQRQFQKQMEYLIFINKKKYSPKTQPHNHNPLPKNQNSFISQNSEKQEKQHHHQNQLVFDEPAPIRELSYSERLEIIGIYNILQLVLSFFVLVTVDFRGLVCLFCWAKMSIYLSQTGNRMMIGFLFKKAIPMYLKVILNLSIWLSGFVFFSMVTYKISKKFETVQLTYYQYIFNYFQYGIFENFRPISKSGPLYSFLYFLQMAFLVMIGNNILQSILAQQVLKNSNMQDLIQFIESIEVECPVCGCPPQVKKKVKLKLTKQNQRQNRFISQYFQSKKQAANKSKYEIKVLSPEFSPMFHKSQLNKKQFKLRKRSMNNISIVGQESMIDTPPLSPIPLSPLSPYSPYSPRMMNQQKKKVKIEIGGQVQQKNTRKIQQYAKVIKTKSEIINKILHQLSKQQSSNSSSVGKHFKIQFLRKKIEEIKSLTAKMQ